jgi:cytidylate kinase
MMSDLVDEYLAQHGQLLICISGVSGAGKTYHAEQLAEKLGLKHIDQDEFFRDRSDLPKIGLSNGLNVCNWDCEGAIDLKAMNEKIRKHLPKGVIFSGFACRDAWFEMPIDYQIHLSVNWKTCLSRRKERGVDPNIYAKCMVKECVFPFYRETLNCSRIDTLIYANKKTDQTMIKIEESISKLLQTKV